MALAPDIYSESQRVEILSALAACDGMPKHAAKRLVEQGLDITWTEVRALREQHTGTYQALAAEIGRTREEAITIAYRENTALAQRLTRNFLDDLLDRQEAGELSREEQRQMPQIVQAITKVQQVSTDKLLSLTGRPTDGGTGNTMLEAVELLERLGVVERVERPTLPAHVDGSAEEV
jgi:hypothetical protein